MGKKISNEKTIFSKYLKYRPKTDRNKWCAVTSGGTRCGVAFSQHDNRTGVILFGHEKMNIVPVDGFTDTFHRLVGGIVGFA